MYFTSFYPLGITIFINKIFKFYSKKMILCTEDSKYICELILKSLCNPLKLYGRIK